MCGITGFISSKYKQTHLEKMNLTIEHRGPDASGSFYDESSGLALGHRRLSILDLSVNSNQPFQSRCGRYTMVFNGEIYNYKEISKNLQAQTEFRPNTTSDTEIVLQAYATWGADFVTQLNGMFAIVIWDKQLKTLNLYRDRMGIKPLFYYSDKDTFAFASELKAIVSLISKPELTLNRIAIHDILHLGYIGSEQTIYSEIKKVKRGSLLIANDKGLVSEKPFWELKAQISKETISNETVAKAKLKEVLNQAIAKRMLADVPLGTFLSGGIDSSTVTAIAQDLSSNPINTFSIGFADDKHDESKYARKIASELKTHHHELILSEQDAIEQVDKMLHIYDEPFGDSSAIPTLLVSQMARKEITVALSGDGGDELFLGYGMYKWAKRLNNPLLFGLRKPFAKGLSTFGNDRIKRGAMVINAPSKKNLNSHIFSQEQYLFSELEIIDLLKQPIRKLKNNGLSNPNRVLNAMERQAFYDMDNYLPNDLLVKVDRASMHHSLEVRVPLLDHNVVELALNIDPKLKYKNGVEKHILKEVLYDYLPKPLFDRPKKGFSIPLSKWLKTDLKHLVDTYLDSHTVEKHGIVNVSKVNALVSSYFNGADYLYNRVWILIQLHRFLEH